MTNQTVSPATCKVVSGTVLPAISGILRTCY